MENTNNRLPRYLPRKSDPTAFTNRYLRSICDRLNATPRKCLGWKRQRKASEQSSWKEHHRPDKLKLQKLRFTVSSQRFKLTAVIACEGTNGHKVRIFPVQVECSEGPVLDFFVMAGSEISLRIPVVLKPASSNP